MNFSLFYGTGYEALFTGISAVIIAQVLKFFVHLVWKRKVDFKGLVSMMMDADLKEIAGMGSAEYRKQRKAEKKS